MARFIPVKATRIVDPYGNTTIPAKKNILPRTSSTGPIYNKNVNATESEFPTFKKDRIKGNFEYNKNVFAPQYTEGKTVQQYRDRLNNYEVNKPGAFQSNYKPQIDNILNGIMNRKSFDMNTDKNYQTLYNQMKESYLQAGDRAMRNAVGNAATLSGGYGNSYAQAVGQQAYDNYLQGLNSKNLELMNMAYGMYKDENADKYNQLRALQGLDESDYGRYRDKVGDFNTERNYLTGRYDAERSFDYDKYKNRLDQFNLENQFNYNVEKDRLAQRNLEQDFNYRRWQDILNQRNTDRQFGYNKEQDALSQQNWLKQFDYNKSQDDRSQDNWLKEFDYNAAQDALAQQNYIEERDWNRAHMGVGGGGGGGGRRGGGGGRRGRRGGGGRSRYRGGGGSNGGFVGAAKNAMAAAKQSQQTGNGWQPLSAGIYQKLKKGTISNDQAYDMLLKGYTNGLIDDSSFNEALKASGVNEQAALKQDIQQAKEDNKRAARGFIKNPVGNLFSKKKK